MFWQVTVAHVGPCLGPLRLHFCTVCLVFGEAYSKLMLYVNSFLQAATVYLLALWYRNKAPRHKV